MALVTVNDDETEDGRSNLPWLAGEKLDVVLRLLRGEKLDALSREARRGDRGHAIARRGSEGTPSAQPLTEAGRGGCRVRIRSAR